MRGGSYNQSVLSQRARERREKETEHCRVSTFQVTTRVLKSHLGVTVRAEVHARLASEATQGHGCWAASSSAI